MLNNRVELRANQHEVIFFVKKSGTTMTRGSFHRLEQIITLIRVPPVGKNFGEFKAIQAR